MPNSKKRPKEQFQFLSALTLVFELGFAIAIPIVLFVTLGRWLDSNLNTTPLFIIIGTIGGLCLAFFSVYRLVKVFLRNGT